MTDNSNQKDAGSSKGKQNQDSNKQNQNSHEQKGQKQRSSEDDEKDYQKREIKATSGDTTNSTHNGKVDNEVSQTEMEEEDRRSFNRTNQLLNEDEESEVSDSDESKSLEGEISEHHGSAKQGGSKTQTQNSKKGN